MANANIVDMVEKLIRLATNNPSPEEARLAALKACELIQKFSIPLGADVVIVKDREWSAPSPDFMATVEEILKGERATYASQWEGSWEPPPAADVGGKPAAPTQGLMIQDRELWSRQEAFRAQMQRAWRAIREERKRIEGWVHNMRVKHGGEFWGSDHPKPW